MVTKRNLHDQRQSSSESQRHRATSWEGLSLHAQLLFLKRVWLAAVRQDAELDGALLLWGSSSVVIILRFYPAPTSMCFVDSQIGLSHIVHRGFEKFLETTSSS